MSDDTMPRSLAKPTDVADYLGVPLRTLDQWRYLGKGPRFRRVGRHVRYRWADVDAWWNAQQGGGEAA